MSRDSLLSYAQWEGVMCVRNRVVAVVAGVTGLLAVGVVTPLSAFAVGADAPDLTAGTTSFTNGITDLQGYLWTLLPIMVGIALVALVIRFTASRVRKGGR